MMAKSKKTQTKGNTGNSGNLRKSIRNLLLVLIIAFVVYLFATGQLTLGELLGLDNGNNDTPQGQVVDDPQGEPQGEPQGKPGQPDDPQGEPGNEDEQRYYNDDKTIFVTKSGWYDDKDHVALYIHTFHALPPNYISKADAEALGWPGGSLEGYADGKSIGGS